MARYEHAPGANRSYGARLSGSGWGDDEFDPDPEATKWSIWPPEGTELTNRVVNGKETTIKVRISERGFYTLTVTYKTLSGEVDSRFTTIECTPVEA